MLFFFFFLIKPVSLEIEMIFLVFTHVALQQSFCKFKHSQVRSHKVSLEPLSEQVWFQLR